MIAVVQPSSDEPDTAMDMVRLWEPPTIFDLDVSRGTQSGAPTFIEESTYTLLSVAPVS